MDTTKYPHPWTQDQALTDRLLKLVDDEDWDLFGIADVGPLNEKARPGRRPKDLWPTAKAVLMFAVGLADPFTRGWVQNGKSGKFYSYALLELDRRVWTVKRFLRQEGYLYFGGEAYGGALFDTGIRFADAAADCGMGYIGKSNVLVTEKYGPRINMTYLMTDAPLVTTIKEVPVRCGRCTACQKVCMSGAILLGQTIAEPFLFAEQAAPGNRGDRISSCAELITLGYLMGFREKIEFQGYQTVLIPPSPLPDARLSRMLAASRKGVVGRNQRFLAGEYGAWHTIGLLLTDAPLMGGDYRYPDVTIDLCDGCRACLDACPCGALTDNGYDADRCREYRDNPDNQERASTHTVMKCMRCMTACDKKRIKELLK